MFIPDSTCRVDFLRYTTIQNIGVGNILKKHPWLHLFDLNYCKNSNIGEKFII